MITKWSITIPELSGDTPRNAYLYLPDEFKRKPNARYPVLYMFDGHNVFFDEDATYGKSWGMLGYMKKSRRPLIIAAVECSHDPDNGRLCEYSPFSFDDDGFGHVTGRGKTTMKWLVNSFKPYIDKRFPTLPDRKHTFIAGSSMGGLMSLYAVMAYNRVFSRAAALSPSLWFDIEKLDRILSGGSIKPDTVVYMDYGSRELEYHGGMKYQFGRVAQRLLERGVMLDCRVVPNGEHTEASWERQIPFFMETLFYDLR